MLAVEVTEVADRRTFRTFQAVPLRCYGSIPQVLAALPVDRRLLAPATNPYFEAGDAAYFVARAEGRAVGRIAAHVPQRDEPSGRFGFFACGGRDEVARALVDAALGWLRDRGCTSMTGPLSFGPEDGAGVPLGGTTFRPTTARRWAPATYPDVLARAGLQAVTDLATYRLRTEEAQPAQLDGAEPAELAVPCGLERYADPALRLRSADGAIVAVPDVAEFLAATGVRGAWSLARRARTHDWARAVVTAVDGPVERLVPALVAAAAAAGYREVLSPWSESEADRPVIVHRLFGCVV